MGEHTAEEVVEVVGNTAGQRSHALQLLLGEIFLLGAFEVGDVGTGADVAGKSAAGVEAGNAVIEQPAVLAIGAAQAVFHLKIAAGLEGGRVDADAAIEIERMHALGPAVTDFLLHGTAGEPQPTLLKNVQAWSGPETQIITGAASAMLPKRRSLSCRMASARRLLGNIVDAQQDLREPIEPPGADHKGAMADHGKILLDLEAADRLLIAQDVLQHDAEARNVPTAVGNRVEQPAFGLGRKQVECVIESRVGGFDAQMGIEYEEGQAAVSMTDMAKSRAAVSAAILECSSWFNAVKVAFVD